MARTPRVFADDAVYLVSGRVARGEPVFADDHEAEALRDILLDLRDRDGLEVLAWSAVGDRYHLVVRTSSVPLWRTMRLLQGRYARGYNRRHRGSGPLWNGRYAATMVGEGQLARAMAAVHLAPVAAGLASDPAVFRWSGHRGLLGEEEDELLAADAALAALGGTPETARAAYRAAIADLVAAATAGGHPVGLGAWRPDRLAARATTRRGDTASRHATGPDRAAVTAAELLELAAPVAGTTVVELGSPRRGSGLTRLRGMIALVGVERLGVRVKDLAAELGRDPASVSRWINACGERRARDVAFRRKLGDLAASVEAAVRAARAARAGFVYDSGPVSFGH